MHSALLLTVIAQLAGTSDALASIIWRMPNVPTQGLTDITFPINIANAPHTSGFYFAQQFKFVNISSVGYTGIQPRPDVNGQPMIQGVFSSFVKGTTSVDPNCSDGADGGSGVSCSHRFVGNYTDTWNIVVNTTGGDIWVGTAVNSRTGEGVHIGSYKLPSQAGGIADGNYGFVEYYPWNTQPKYSCASLPYTEGTFFPPISNSTTKGTSKGTVRGSITSCKENITQIDSAGTVKFILV